MMRLNKLGLAVVLLATCMPLAVVAYFMLAMWGVPVNIYVVYVGTVLFALLGGYLFVER